MKQLKVSDFCRTYIYDYDHDQFNRQDIRVELMKAGTFTSKNSQTFGNYLFSNLYVYTQILVIRSSHPEVFCKKPLLNKFRIRF